MQYFWLGNCSILSCIWNWCLDIEQNYYEIYYMPSIDDIRQNWSSCTFYQYRETTFYCKSINHNKVMLNFFLYTHCPLLDFCHDASSPLFFRNQLLVCNVMHAIIVGKFVSKNFRDCWFYCTEYFKLRRIKRKFMCLNIISMALNMTHIPFPSTVCEYLLCSLTYWMIFLDRINSFI